MGHPRVPSSGWIGYVPIQRWGYPHKIGWGTPLGYRVAQRVLTTQQSAGGGLSCYRPHLKDGEGNIFSLFTLVGRGDTPSQVWVGGTPSQVWVGDTPSQAWWCTPSQVWIVGVTQGTPQPGLDGGRYPGYPPSQVWMVGGCTWGTPTMTGWGTPHTTMTGRGTHQTSS